MKIIYFLKNVYNFIYFKNKTILSNLFFFAKKFFFKFSSTKISKMGNCAQCVGRDCGFKYQRYYGQNKEELDDYLKEVSKLRKKT